MQLYCAEYRRVFTESRRIVLFHAREDWFRSIASQLVGSGEYLYEVQIAATAMGLPTDFVNLEYKTRKKRKSKYRRFTKKK